MNLKQASEQRIEGASIDDYAFEKLRGAFVSPIIANALSIPSFAVQIRDLSNTAVSFAVGADGDKLLQAHHKLKLTVKIPGTDTPSIISCRVRYRSRDGARFLYRCDYDWSGTLNALAVVEDLMAYTLHDAS
jgi:hypothetical protein